VRLTRVIAKLEPGGAQLAALRITAELSRRGVTTRLLAGETTTEGLDLCATHGVAVEVWGQGEGLQYRPSRAFADWLRPRLADAAIVHAHMFGAWWAAALAVPAGVPLVASEHNALRWPAAPPWEELSKSLARIDGFFAHGAQVREAMLGAGLAPEKLMEGMSPVAGLGSAPRAGLPRPRIVFAGRLHEEKGPDLMLDALARMATPPDTFMLGDGPLEPALRARVAELGLEREVHMPGWVADPGPFVAGATVQVVPSRDEAWSQSAVLAMGLGVPVVGTAVGGLPHTLADGRGLLVPPEDPAALAALLADVMAGRVRHERAAGRAYAQRFTVERVAAHYLRAYQELRANSGHEAPERPDTPATLAGLL